MAISSKVQTQISVLLAASVLLTIYLRGTLPAPSRSSVPAADKATAEGLTVTRMTRMKPGEGAQGQSLPPVRAHEVSALWRRELN